MPTGIYEMMQGALAAGQQGAEQGKQRRLAQMMSQAMSGPADQRQGAVAQMAAVSPQAAFDAQSHFAQMDDVSRKRLGEHAMMFDALPDEQKAQAYPQLAAEAQALGIPAPPQWSESFRPGIQRLAQAFGGMGGKQEMASHVINGRLVDNTGKVLYEAPTNGQLVNVPDGQGGSVQMLFDPSAGRLTQPQYGGAAQTAGPTGGASQVLGDALTSAVMQQESGGDPSAVSPAGARGLMQLMPGTQRDPGFGVAPAKDDSPQENVRLGRDYLQAMLHRYNGDQQLALAAYNAGPGRVDDALRSAGGDPHRAIGMLPQETQKYVPSVQGRLGYTPPKPNGGKAAPNGYRWNAAGGLEVIPGGPAEVAQAARADAAAAKKAAQDAKVEQARQGQQTRQAEAATAADSLVSAIDRLTQSAGFDDLGTSMGDLKLHTPLIRSDVKDADAQLKNIAGQVALTTMARLKALSAQGATGFGALSEKELGLLQNSIATLQSDQISNAQLKESLKVIRNSMAKVSAWKGSAPATPAAPSSDIDSLLEKYR